MTTKTKKAPAKRGPFILQDAATKLYLKDDDTFTADPMDAEAWDSEQEAINAIKDLADEAAHDGVTFRHWHQGNAAAFGPHAPEDAAEDAEFVGPTDDVQPDAAPIDEDSVHHAPDTTEQGELLPPGAGSAPATPTPVTGILQLASPGVAVMTATALRAHAADLKKLAKGARELSQPKEAATFEQNAAVIEETLLTQLEPQAKLPFGYADVKTAVSARISGKLRAQLTEQVKRDTPIVAGETDKDRQDKIKEKIADFEALVGNVATIVTALVEPVITQAAEKGMLAGRLARETTADVLALEAVEAVGQS